MTARDSKTREAVRTALKKAAAWYRDETLVTDPESRPWTPPKAAIHIGQLVAIEYLSDKFDGTERVYRHDFTQLRELHVSANGDTFIVLPGCKITTRGIEG